MLFDVGIMSESRVSPEAESIASGEVASNKVRLKVRGCQDCKFYMFLLFSRVASQQMEWKKWKVAQDRDILERNWVL